MPYFASAFVRGPGGWSGEELDLSDVEDLDGVTDLLRDLSEDTGPAVVFVEEDDEYFLVVRVDPGQDEARTFLSDVRALETSDLAARLYDESVAEPLVTDDEATDADDDDEETTAQVEGEPGGDDTILADLGTAPLPLRELCAEEGLLPADIIYTLCERAGCADVLERLRGA